MSVLNQVSNDSCLCLFNDASGPSGSAGGPFHGRQIMSIHEKGGKISQTERQKKKEMDALLCQAMDNLSLEERKKQQDILHGISEPVEDAALLSRSLQDLDDHLKSMKHKTMYEVAERIDAEYVHARAFRVMFLRANEYDAKASADQMLRFFESKYQLFGIEKLVEDITFADLNEEDIACLKTGHFQLAGRDRSGRQVIAHLGGLSGRIESWLRVQYFVKMRALEDEETQLRGIISILCAIGGFKDKNNRRKFAEGLIAASAIPQKKQAIHICIDEMWQYVGGKVLIKLVKGDMRARLRVHYGTQMECQYQLAAYGIQPQSMPLDPKGRVELSRHLNWIQSCAMEDRFFRPALQPRTPDVNVTPSPNDVLFTSGTATKHLGNQRFQSLIQNYAQAYDVGEAETKRQVATNVIEKIQESSGARFLQRRQTNEGPAWKEVSPEELRTKIMQAFRNRRRMTDPSKRRKADDCVNGTLLAGEPLPNDVIFGRGQRNQGSELLHRLIKEHSEEYESLGRGVKMGLVETMMQTIIEEHDGRFLVKLPGEPDRWVELSHNNVRDRISKCFRNYRRPPKGAK